MPRAIGQGYAILGLTACPACSKEIPAKKTGGGKLSLCCTWCDLAIYVNAGTKAFALLVAKVKAEAPPSSSSAAGAPASDGKAAAASDAAPAPAAGTASSISSSPAPKPQDKAPRRGGVLFGGS